MPKNNSSKKVQNGLDQIYIWDVITPAQTNLNQVKNIKESKITNVNNSSGFLWLESVVIGVVGKSLTELPENQKLSLMRECIKLFMDFSYNYISDKYNSDEAESLRLMFYPNLPAIQRFQIESLFWEAYQEFMKLLDK